VEEKSLAKRNYMPIGYKLLSFAGSLQKRKPLHYSYMDFGFVEMETFWHSCVVSSWILITHFYVTGTVEAYPEIDLMLVIFCLADRFLAILTMNL